MERLKQITQLLKDNPEDIFLHYAQAMEYMSNENIDLAIEKLEFIRNKDASYLPLYYQLGQLYITNENETKAIEIFTEGIDISIQQGEIKTMNELKSAIEELTF